MDNAKGPVSVSLGFFSTALGWNGSKSYLQSVRWNKNKFWRTKMRLVLCCFVVVVVVVIVIMVVVVIVVAVVWMDICIIHHS